MMISTGAALMPFSTLPNLSPEDLIASRSLFSRIFQGLFPHTSLNFYFPDRPQATLNWKEGGKLEEFGDGSWAAEREMNYDPERKRLFWPLVFHGKPIGFLVFFGLPQVPEAKERTLLDRLTNLALEMAALKKQVQLDPVTGFYHEWAFRKFLIQELKDWSLRGGDQKPEKLSLARGGSAQTLILGFMSLQLMDTKAGSFATSLETDSQMGLKDITKGFPKGTILATIQHHPLLIGFVFSSWGEENRPPFLPFQSTPELENHYIYHVGWSGVEHRDQETFQGNPSKYALMTHWWDKAWTALEAAQYLGDNIILSYDEILNQAGKVMDLLPSHRIVINLGKKAGVSPFMRFSILGGDNPELEKGQAIPLEIQENLCIAEVIYLRESGMTIQKNDWVRLISTFGDKMGDSKGEVSLTNGPLRSFQMFQLKFREALKITEKFSLLIGRLDDYADRLKLWGEKSLSEIQKEMSLNIEERLPPGAVVGPYGRDGFILFIPEMEKEAAGLWARNLMDQLKRTLNLSLSVVLADYPCTPFHKGEILDNTIKTLDHLAFLGPGSLVVFDSVSLNISGDKLYNHGDVNGAIREYEKALVLDPDNINVLNSLGVCRANLGQLEQAIESFLRVLTLTPDDFIASFNLGFAYVRLGMVEKAIAIWEELAQKDEVNFDLAYHLGRLYREQGDFSQAFTWFKKAEEAPDKKGFIYRVLGENEESQGKKKEAMAYFKKALKVFPQDAFSLSCLGSLYLQQGESIKVALSLCQQATRIEPAKGPYWMNLGKALLMNGFPKRAVNALHQALSLGEYSKEVYRLLGLSLRTLGRHKDALDCFIEALKRDPNDQEILGYLNEKEKG
jgi:tetratricopeptide (TPR) repeat protein